MDRGIRRFICAQGHQELILRLFGEAFDENENHLYRLDSLQSETAFDLGPDEVVACFHVGKLNQAAIDFSRGKEIIHLICAGVNYLDVNGRFPGEAAGWTFYSDLEYWS
jgi:hypothetical protein